MKMMKPLLILVFAGLAAGQIPDTHRTNGSLNCRYWNATQNPSLRVGIVMGHAELWDLAQRAMPTLPPLKRPILRRNDEWNNCGLFPGRKQPAHHSRGLVIVFRKGRRRDRVRA
jgi:hypothetical protein